VLQDVFGTDGATGARSPQALRAWEAEQDAFLRRLRAAADGRRLSDLDRVSAAILLEWLESSAAARACRFELWALGWQSTYSQLAQLQPVDTPEHRAAALARLRSLPALVDQEMANLREGIRLGYLASRGSVERALTELDALIALPTTEWPFLDPGRRASDPLLAAEMEREVAERLAPATRRYHDFLRSEYLPRSRIGPGVLANPEGAACYRGAVRSYVTLDLPPERIHEIGLQELAHVEAEMKALSERVLGTSDLSAVRRMLQTDERYTFATREDLLEAIDRTIAKATAALPRWFGRVPTARVTARPWPEFQARSSPPDSYRRVARDGAVEGVYLVNAFVPRKKSRPMAQVIALHETVPGHHLQAALAYENAAVPGVGRFLLNSGFNEGWSVYAERLADEMGLYASDVERLGMLAGQSFRAARLVIDTGIHAFGWTKERAVGFVLDHSVMSPERAASEVDRYADWPGQATAYTLGAFEIRRLRSEAEAALGSAFDVKSFHDALLGMGSVPLPFLRSEIEAWIARQHGPAGSAAGAALAR
jgi:uncharacterized protein (DUF885 family)